MQKVQPVGDDGRKEHAGRPPPHSASRAGERVAFDDLTLAEGAGEFPTSPGLQKVWGTRQGTKTWEKASETYGKRY